MPETIDKALHMAILATNAEKEEKASVREDRGVNAKVFTVGGSRGGIQNRRYSQPRSRFQWSRNRGAWSRQGAGQVQPIRVDGTHSYRTDSRSPAQPATIRTAELVRLQDRRTMTIVSRQIDHLTFNVLIAG